MIASLSIPIIQKPGKALDVNADAINGFESILDDSVKDISKIPFRKAYTTANVNIRRSANLKSEILDVAEFNKQINIYDCDDEWAMVKLKKSNNHYAYVNKKYISEDPCEYKEYFIPDNKGFKSYMSYTAISDISSLQYYLQQNYAYTGEFGIRQVNNRFCVAIGTAFHASIGTYFDLILENKVSIPCIVADIKADKDTCADNIITATNGCVSEFVVNMNTLEYKAKKNGDISSCCEEWNSPVNMIRIYDKNIFK